MKARDLGAMPALPIPMPKGEWPLERIAEMHVRCQGLTKREAFASSAMTALLSNPNWTQVATTTRLGLAESTVLMATATAEKLLAELAKASP